MTFLLDVNVLIALVDPQHVAHETAHAWFGAEGRDDWATCPLTENGLVRIITQRRYTNFLGAAAEALEVLGAICRLGNHIFWSDSISLLDGRLVESSRLTASRQVTDTYLLALAVAHGGRLATFDRRLSPAAVLGGSKALHILR